MKNVKLPSDSISYADRLLKNKTGSQRQEQDLLNMLKESNCQQILHTAKWSFKNKGKIKPF